MQPHLSLYRKYRPATFADLVGQDVVATALRSAVAQNRVSHAYLFSGIRGTGKTSAARVLARALMCHRRADMSGEPCNECEGCLSVAQGTALDLIEIDAASNRGIDDIRDLREQVRYLPAAWREGFVAYKLYIIDEAHMLTTEAFNALLKTLEEPPPHVVFVLCTTDVERVPATVLGRCQRFHFRPYTSEVIAGHLGRIAASESVELPRDVAALMAQAAGGSMRDAVGFLDQALNLGAALDVASVRRLLGLTAGEVAGSILESVLNGDGALALNGFADALAAGAGVPQLAVSLATATRDRLLSHQPAERERLLAVLDELLRLIPELRHQPDPRPLVEAALVKLALSPSGGATHPAAGPAPLAARTAPAAAAAEIPREAPLPHDSRAPATVQAASPAPAVPAAPSAGGGAGDSEAAASSPPVAGELTLEGVRAGWPDVMELVKQRDVMVHAMLKEAVPVAVEEGRLVLAFRYGFHCERVAERENTTRVVEAVRGVTGSTVNLVCRVAPEVAAAAAAPRPEDHPAVRTVLESVGGEITSIRVKGAEDGG